jgi:4-hydroxy-tetrahydrodipicolinate synthase
MENYPKTPPAPAEVYPVMLTPFTDGGEVDYESLLRLIRWYEEGGATGLFAVCLSSEMFYLSIEERVAIAQFSKRHSRLPVVASGHVGGSPEQQLDDVQAMISTGADAAVLISNAFANQDEDDNVLIDNLGRFLDQLEPSIPLGIYECPAPYKRVLSDKVIAFIIKTGRFIFLKDTCCDIEQIKGRLRLAEGTPFKLYNAHAQTLVESLVHGATGYSGIQANCSIRLLSRICTHFGAPDQIAEDIDLLDRVATFCPKYQYPICAKEILRARGVFKSIHTRFRVNGKFDEVSSSASSSMLNDLLAFEGRISAN